MNGGRQSVGDKPLNPFRDLKDSWALTKDVPSSEKERGISGETEAPKLDLYETEEHIVAEVDLPGWDAAGISVRVLDNRLILEGRQDSPHEQGNFIRMERCQEDFRRILLLPCAVDPKNAFARYERGVLTLRLPKIVDRRRKAVKIPIK
jgi:HSP20 family protein